MTRQLVQISRKCLLRVGSIRDITSAIGHKRLFLHGTRTAIFQFADEEARRTVKEIEARILRTDTRVVFGAFIDSELVGIAGLRRGPLDQVKHKAVLWGVFVSVDWRREGLARKLFARVQSFAREEGVLQIQLCVNAENVRARNLYHSLGFELFGV